MLKPRQEKFRFTSLAFLLAASLLSCFSIVWSAESFIVGWEDWPPYQYKDEKGKLTGIDVELVKAILNEAGMDAALIFKKLPWKRHQEELKDGRVDLAACSSWAPKRKAYAYFSEPYRTETVVLFVRQGDKTKYPFKNITDIKLYAFRLGATLEYYYGETFESMRKDPKYMSLIEEVPHNYINHQKLIAKRIDGFLADPLSAKEGLRKEHLLDKVEVHPLPLYTTDIFVMFSKKTTSLEQVNRFNKGISRIKKNGRYDQIISKFLH